jgi:AraC-like DNA-binding protein
MYPPRHGQRDNEAMASRTGTVDTGTVDEHVPHVPAAALRPYVTSFTGYRQAGVPPAVHRGLPSPWMTVIFTLDEPLMIAAHPDPGQRPGTFDTLIGGLHTSPALISHDGAWSGIQVALSPLGARALLGMPAAELASIDAHGADVLGPLASHVHDRLQDLPGWAERYAFLEEALLGLMRGSDGTAQVSSEVRYAWRRLLRTGGTEPVSALAAETGWSDRHLRARFRAEIGLGPKEAARVIRFDRARRLLMRRASAGEQPGLAELAASAGYFDQAHLDRDFKMMAGCAPTRWLVTESGNFHAAPPGPPPE